MTDLLAEPMIQLLLYGTIGAMVVALLYWYFVPKPKVNFLFERIRQGHSVVRMVKEERLKNPGDLLVHLPDKRKYLVPSGRVGDSELVEVPKTLKLKKGFHHFWWLEGDRLVKIGWSLLSPPTEIMDHQTSTVVANRRTAGRLSTQALGGGGWTMILLAGVAAFAVGYIMYPMFNHAPTVLEYCSRGINGTQNCSLVPP